jgi:hypothetical protein
MDAWDTIEVIVGGGSAALIGALFVAVSIKIDVIARSVELRNRAAQALDVFMTPLLATVLLAVPNQPRPVLGAELLALGLAAGAVAIVLDRRAKQHHDETTTLARALQVATPNAITTILTALAGLLLVVHVDAGLYLLVPAFVTGITGGVVSAWLFLTRIA